MDVQVGIGPGARSIEVIDSGITLLLAVSTIFQASDPYYTFCTLPLTSRARDRVLDRAASTWLALDRTNTIHWQDP
jgi:hypothetical protein